MDPAEFQIIVDRAVAHLPERFRAAVKDVVILVRDRPDPRGHRTHSRRSGLLLGLYEGTPITEWLPEYSGKLPDTITLFREHIEAAGQPEDIPHVVSDTLLHEIAHHFGFDHDRIDVMEERWRARREPPAA